MPLNFLWKCMCRFLICHHINVECFVYELKNMYEFLAKILDRTICFYFFFFSAHLRNGIDRFASALTTEVEWHEFMTKEIKRKFISFAEWKTEWETSRKRKVNCFKFNWFVNVKRCAWHLNEWFITIAIISNPSAKKKNNHLINFVFQPLNCK